MKQALTAKASIIINAPTAKTWDALVNPDAIKQYMFGTEVISNWSAGSIIRWKGEWKGKSYEDKGVILKMIPLKVLQYSHFSPLSGQPDVPDNYHIVTLELTDEKDGVKLMLTQNNNAIEEEKDHSEKNCQEVLKSLKAIVEKKSAAE
jgi:uncharacterized protein YndB with AHSA1/START domain